MAEERACSAPIRLQSAFQRVMRPFWSTSAHRSRQSRTCVKGPPRCRRRDPGRAPSGQAGHEGGSQAHAQVAEAARHDAGRVDHGQEPGLWGGASHPQADPSASYPAQAGQQPSRKLARARKATRAEATGVQVGPVSPAVLVPPCRYLQHLHDPSSPRFCSYTSLHGAPRPVSVPTWAQAPLPAATFNKLTRPDPEHARADGHLTLPSHPSLEARGRLCQVRENRGPRLDRCRRGKARP